VSAGARLRDREARVNGIRLHWVEQGEGPLVLLLHGFPESSYAWRNQLPALARAGFRAAAPDLRGYGLSERPLGVRAYRLETLLGDVEGLIDVLGGEGDDARAHLVGHDWGGACAWTAPLFFPEKLLSLAILNSPHPRAFRRELRTSRDQQRRSAYMLFFQLPRLPELVIRSRHFSILAKRLRREPVNPGAFTEEDVARTIADLALPGALTAALNWYRAARRYPLSVRGREWPAGLRTLVVWGMRDRYLSPTLLDGLEAWVPNLAVHRLDASHWVQNDAADEVNGLLEDFFRGLTPARSR
jgi:pimeloyl-ACP methyl ester carboxylesterase